MAQVVENNSGITFDSDWICFITAKKLQRDMTSTPTRQLRHITAGQS